MIILREKIKNEEGIELLRMLGETWNYFFKEILPTLQSMLYPLTSLLSKGESVRSLALLAFRNIVVLKVNIREALDNVEKRNFPPSIQQMLLILQNIQDNVFLSENQFLLEKLVARVVSPYLGQRGLYEGSPTPVIKVKLKPIPIHIPSSSGSKADGSSRCEGHRVRSEMLRTEGMSTISPLMSKKERHDLGMKRLKPVLEHVDGTRRHSVIS